MTVRKEDTLLNKRVNYSELLTLWSEDTLFNKDGTAPVSSQ